MPQSRQQDRSTIHLEIVQVWHATASTTEPGQVEICCEDWLPDEERTQANRFKRSTTRNQHVVGRGIARWLLGGPQVDTKDIQFELLDHGKPKVQSPSNAMQSFNVAHTEGLVLCGITPRSNLFVGVDVERLERRTDPELANRYFAEPEVEFLNQFEGENRQSMFLRIWTLKESFIKAIGTGLHTPLADFAFEDIESTQPRLRILNNNLQQSVDWTFHCFTPRPGFIASVAIGDERSNVQHAIELQSFDDWLGSQSSQGVLDR